MPSKTTDNLPVILTHIHQDFLVIKIWGIVDKDKYNYIQETIEKKSNDLLNTSQPVSSQLLAGTQVLVYYKNHFHRAEIIEKKVPNDDGTVPVIFIDSGISSSIDVKNIVPAELVPETLKCKGLAKEFILNKVMSISMWSKKHQSAVNHFMKNHSEITLNNTIEGRHFIEVICNFDSKLTNLSDYLIKNGLVKAVPDSFFVNFFRRSNKCEEIEPMLPVGPHYLGEHYIYPKLSINSTHEVLITHVIDGMNAFTVQFKKHDNIELCELMGKISNIKPSLRIVQQVAPGYPCLGRSRTDFILRRAVIAELFSRDIRVYFVDFGTSEILSFRQIYEIPAEFLQVPVMAAQFALASSSCALNWPDAANKFARLVHTNRIFTLKVMQPSSGKYTCELFISQDGKCLNVESLICDKNSDEPYEKIQFEKNQVTDVKIIYSESPLKFFVHLEYNRTIVEMIQMSVAEYMNSDNRLTCQEDIVENMAVCAPYKDNKFCRGLVIGKPDHQANVTIFCVDYGTRCTVPFNKLTIIKNGILSKFPMQAIECRLNVDESMINEKVIEVFKGIVDGKTLRISVQNIISNVLIVDLYDSNGLNVAIHLAEILSTK